MNIGEWLREEIGVGPVGHRRKLLDAIAALSPGKPLPAIPEAAAGAPADIASAERRQLTVMFCDLIGSTELATRHDAEARQYD